MYDIPYPVRFTVACVLIMAACIGAATLLSRRIKNPTLRRHLITGLIAVAMLVGLGLFAEALALAIHNIPVVDSAGVTAPSTPTELTVGR